MLTVVIVAVIAWVCVLSSRRTHFIKFSQHGREQAPLYARAESQNVDAVAQVADLEREVTSALPPAAGSDKARGVPTANTSLICKPRSRLLRLGLMNVNVMTRCAVPSSGSPRGTIALRSVPGAVSKPTRAAPSKFYK